MKTLLLTIFAALAMNASAQVSPPSTNSLHTVTMVWDHHPDTRVNKFRLYWGPSLSALTNRVESSTNGATVSGIKYGTTFAVSAVTSDGLESPLSAPYTLSQVAAPTALRVSVVVRVDVQP
jgi:hypothetical protein